MENIDEDQINSGAFTPSNYVGSRRWRGTLMKRPTPWKRRGDKNQDKRYATQFYLPAPKGKNFNLKSYLRNITGKG